jgi:hypothetical protein
MKTNAQTANQMKDNIAALIDKRSIEAGQSQYDRHVCANAISTTRDIFNRVRVEGTASEYGQAVISALSDLRETYNDTDGEYTSGKAPIGDVYHDVLILVNNLRSNRN